MITLHADRERVDLLGLLFNLTTIVMLISFMVVIFSILIMWCFAGILSSLRSNTSNCSNKYCKNTTPTFYCNGLLSYSSFLSNDVKSFGNSWYASTATGISEVSASSTSVEIMGIPYPVATLLLLDDS